MKKCKKCGSEIFIIQEFISQEAFLCEEDEILSVYKDKDNGIDRIFCRNCDTDYLESDFKGIEFR